MQCSINQLSELTGRDRRTIKKRIEALPTDDKGRYDSSQALPLLYGSKGELDPSQERAKLDQVRRELAEIQRDERLGNLIPADVVLDRWSSEASRIRAKLLNLPGRLATVLTGADQSHASIEADSRKLIYEALAELSSGGLDANH